MMTRFTAVFGRVLMLLLTSWLGLATQARAQLDLTVAAPITCPSTVYPGGIYALGATIHSTAAAQFGFIGVYLSRDNAWDATDVYLNSVGANLIFSPHSAALTINVTIPSTTTAGNYHMVFVADPLNMEREINEQNNVRSVPVTVAAGNPLPLPDVTLWRPSISLNTSPAGGQIGAFTFVSNRGAAGAGNIELGYYLSTDTLLSTNDVIMGTSGGISLVSNNMTITSNPVLTIPATTRPGAYYVLLVADHLNRITESDETNNSRALAFTVTGTTTAAQGAAQRPALHVYPNPVGRGQQLRIELGAAARKAPTTVVLRNALGQEVLRHRVVVAGSEQVLDVSGMAPGSYLVEARAGEELLVRQRLLVQ